jgi:hypothetical protein
MIVYVQSTRGTVHEREHCGTGHRARFMTSAYELDEPRDGGFGTVREWLESGTYRWCRRCHNPRPTDLPDPVHHGDVFARIEASTHADLPVQDDPPETGPEPEGEWVYDGDKGRYWLAMSPGDFDFAAPTVQGALFVEPDRCGTPDLFA